MSDNKNTNSESKDFLNDQELRSLMIPELNMSKLAFLGLLAFLFASLEPFALFASIPFTISFLLYGKMKTFMMGIIGVALAILLVQVKVYQGSALGTFPLAVIYGYLISAGIMRKDHPAKAIFINGASIFAVMMTLILTFNFSLEEGVRGFLAPYVQKTATQYYNSLEKAAGVPGEQLRQLKDVMENPSLVVDPIMNYGTGFIFVGVLLSFWVGTFVALRMAPLWKPFHDYEYDIKTLTGFQMPFQVVWPLIFGLVLAVGHAYGFVGDWAEVLGYNTLLILGIFYFFQGFGVFSELLTYWQFFGFLRSMVIFFAVIMAYQILALVGVLDTWVNFRRFFNKKNDEGDTL
ncbi:MAG: YybS family protein [Bacteriovoracaceae bacterium]|nr:YybS family protein [Bacteriovoracaceae bacterium]